MTMMMMMNFTAAGEEGATLSLLWNPTLSPLWDPIILNNTLLSYH